MNHRPEQIATILEPASRLDTVIEWLMGALLLFMPLAFGSVEAWSEMVVVAIAAAMTVCLIVKLTVRRDARLVWTWAYVPVGLFVLLAACQLIPLPAGLVRAISPQTVVTKTALLDDLPNADAALKSVTLSFYPCATKHDLRLVLAVAAVFFVVVNVYRRADQIKRLLGVIAVIGAGVALLALAQIISGTDRIYWTVPSSYKLADAGPFANHSNYSQFMNLSIAAALGLLLVKLHEGFRGSRVTLPGVVERLTNPHARTIWWLAGAIVVGAATVLLSLSRAGAFSLLIAGTFTAVLLTAKTALGRLGWFMALLALGAFVCVLYVGFDAVYDRLATLRDVSQYGGRWQIVKDIAVAWTKFPALGAGLGTHEVVYPMFDRATIPALAGHAENEYAQAAEETGIIGLGLLVGFAAMIWRDYVHNVRRTTLPIRSAVFGLGFGLLAVLIHSLSDFGQHLPANACLSAIACGLLINLARMKRSRQVNVHPVNRPAERCLKPLGVLAMAAVAVLSGWALIGANDARAAEGHYKQAVRLEKGLQTNEWLGSNADYAELISHAAAAAESQPEKVEYHYWLNVYRWRSIRRVRDPETGSVVPVPDQAEFTRRIVDELHKARELCPTFGPIYCVVGQLEKFVLQQETGARRIREGFRLAPYDPTTCFVAGALDAFEEKIDESMSKFGRALELDGRLFGDIAEVYVHQIKRPDLAVEIAGDNIAQLLAVARMLAKQTEHYELADRARTKAVEALKVKCRQADASASTLAAMAEMCRKDEDYDSAVGYYRRALGRDYGQVHWRLALARTLAASGQVDQAIHEARVCLRIRPQMEAARKLIADLSVRG